MSDIPTPIIGLIIAVFVLAFGMNRSSTDSTTVVATAGCQASWPKRPAAMPIY